MDTSRPHYKKSWPPVVYAVCLWLNQVGFVNTVRVWSEENKMAAVTPALPSPLEMKNDDDDSVNKDRLYLLLGIALCFCG